MEVLRGGPGERGSPALPSNSPPHPLYAGRGRRGRLQKTPAFPARLCHSEGSEEGERSIFILCFLSPLEGRGLR
jgi:hypothetical protein